MDKKIKELFYLGYDDGMIVIKPAPHKSDKYYEALSAFCNLKAEEQQKFLKKAEADREFYLKHKKEDLCKK